MKMNYAAHARSFAAIALLATGLLVLAQSAMAIVTGHEAPPPASPTVQHSVVQSGNQRCTQITPPGTPNVGPAPGPDWICVQTDPGGGGEDPQQFDPANYVENGKLIRASYAVKGLGENLFGDSINLYRGTLEFSQTDVSLPGNSALPVAATRALKVGGKSNYGYVLNSAES